MPREHDEPFDDSRLRNVVKAPVGEPVNHTKILADHRFEQPQSFTGFSAEYTWFFLGFAYTLIKIDRSLFEVYQSFANETVPVRTFQADRYFLQVPQAPNFKLNQNAYIIQGIPSEYAERFVAFVESYVFDRKDTNEAWRCQFGTTLVPDPFALVVMPLPLTIAYPVNTTKKRYWTMTKPPGPHLGSPEFGVGTYE